MGPDILAKVSGTATDITAEEVHAIERSARLTLTTDHHGAVSTP
jgi:hypothetical protein